MAGTTHETPKARGMTRTWGVIALVVLLVVLALAWLFGLFDGEPTGTVVSDASQPAPAQVAARMPGAA